MKMYLKNKQLKKINFKKIKFTSRNLFIFLVSFSVVALILGILFYYLLNQTDKINANQNALKYFTLSENYNYLNILKSNILKNTFNTFIIWILGISIIGVIATIFIYFCQIFSIGFMISSIIGQYKIKGIIGILCYLMPSRICYIITLFLLTFFAFKISYKLIKLCFFKDDINIKKEIKKYFKILVISFIAMLAISMLEVFIDPIFIKIFTKI